MAMNPDVSFIESLVRSGHSTGTNQDPYVDRCNFALASAGGNAINHWKDVHTPVYPPRITCLTDMEREHALRMIDELFIITTVDFLPNGVLRPVLICSFAALVMYYPQTIHELGMQHALSLAIRNAGIAAEIRSRGGETVPHKVLLDWSKQITDDF